jgi:peroxiredoxin
MMTAQVGEAAPDFTLRTLQGEDFTLSAFRGKQPVIIAFYPLAFTGG